MNLDEVKKILLVDDDIDLLDQNKLLLEAKGFKVVTSENAEDGFKVFQREKPDAAIIDLMMEQMDSGFILSYKIKKTEHGKKIPVFILTAATYETGLKFSASTSEEKEWIKCDGVLNKPVIVDELLAKIESFKAV